MTAEELAANQRSPAAITDPVARDVARWASARQLTPVAMAAFSVCFGVIAAVWLTGFSLRDEAIALAALLAAFVAGRAARLMGGRQAAPATEWGRAACAVLTELAVYAGIAAGATIHAASGGLAGPAGDSLRGTSLAGLGGPGPAGVWRLAVTAVIVLAVAQMADFCLPPAAEQGPRARRFQALVATPGDERLLAAGAAVLLAGARVTYLLLMVAGVLALGAVVARHSGSGPRPRRLPGYRGDGPLSVWIGHFVDGRLPPLPPLLVGLLVTGVLTVLGLQNLPGILVFTPVEAMLLAALGSWHPHDGRRDWLVPPLLLAGESVYLVAAGFAGRVYPAVTLALLGAVVLRHLDLAYWARNQLVPGTDLRGLGWEGRLIIAGLAAAVGILPMIYPLLALYLWWLLARDWIAGWSARHAAVDG